MNSAIDASLSLREPLWRTCEGLRLAQGDSCGEQSESFGNRPAWDGTLEIFVRGLKRVADLVAYLLVAGLLLTFSLGFAALMFGAVIVVLTFGLACYA